MTFDEIVRAIRTQLGISQERFAHELNISFSTISRWENGHTSPSCLAKMRLLEYCSKHDIDAGIISQLEKS